MADEQNHGGGQHGVLRRQPGARAALLTLTAVNLLNMADRYVASSVKESIKRDLQLTDAETALPMTGMVVVYMVCAMAFGIIADRHILNRTTIVAAAVVLWSMASALASLSHNIWQLVFFRSLVGVGEAAFGTIAGPMISDLYPPWQRTMAFAIYTVAGPIGGALGYGVGAILASSFGWRAAFLMVGLPGVAAGLAVLSIQDPSSGRSARGRLLGDGEDRPMETRGVLRDFGRIAANPHFAVATLGLVAVNFAIGGLADWVASFLQRYDGASLSSAGLMAGAVTAIAGVGGGIVGAKVSSALERRTHNAAFLTAGLFSVPAALMGMLTVNFVGSQSVAYASLLAMQVCLWTHLSPLQNLSLRVIPLEMRARSAGLQILLTHVLGDVISPPIIGEISDRSGSLQTGMQVTWVMMFVAGGLWLWGYACLPPLPGSSCSSDADATAGAGHFPATVWSLLHDREFDLSDAETSCGSDPSSAPSSGDDHYREL
mmetsp:Transcript_41770/g.120664  ORF Transcript_41770/g.120664 Transcript_41770/m.120664 type:complete len:488 (+) Transcript_41770:33-1496(+)